MEIPSFIPIPQVTRATPETTGWRRSSASPKAELSFQNDWVAWCGGPPHDDKVGGKVTWATLEDAGWRQSSAIPKDEPHGEAEGPAIVAKLLRDLVFSQSR